MWEPGPWILFRVAGSESSSGLPLSSGWGCAENPLPKQKGLRVCEPRDQRPQPQCMHKSPKAALGCRPDPCVGTTWEDRTVARL